MIALCWRYAGALRWQMLLFYGLLLCANIFLMMGPYILGQVINTLQLGSDTLLYDVGVWLILYTALTLAFWVFYGPSRVIERTLAFHIKKRFSLKYYDIITQMPLSWHYDHHTGNTVNRLNQASSSLYEFAQTQSIYIENIFRFILVFVLIGFINIYISVSLFALTVVSFFILSLFDKVLIRKTHEVNERQHIYSSRLFDYMANIENVIMFNLQKKSKSVLEDRLDALYPPLKKEIYTNGYKWFLLTVIVSLMQFIGLFSYIIYHQWQDIPLMLGTLVMLFQYMVRLDAVFIAFAAHYERIVRYFTDMATLEPISESYKALESKNNKMQDLHVSDGKIEFSNLSFKHEDQHSVFEDFCLTIEPQEKVGLVGPSGAGKTTLIRLLLGFYDDACGNIYIDGQPLKDVSDVSLREQVAVIPQDVDLFEETLLENIRYGRPDASDEEVVEAAKKAYADDFIMDLDDGYHSMVGERGVKLSGGQRQRVAIARAILKDAPILILDEATSAVDSESEFYIQKSLEDIMIGKTVIAVAHRLSTLTRLDRLIVMDQGCIKEDGTHDQLLKNKARYAKLWSMQSGGFLNLDTDHSLSDKP